jgi:uncharacterized protein involved in exopolysaccharide biosynthesis
MYDPALFVDMEAMLAEEIDLRPYFEALLRNWKWIVAAAVLAALAGFGVATLIPPTYEAKALVVFTQPSQLVQFDPRFEALPNVTQPLKAYPELATSDEVLQQLLQQIAPPIKDVTALQDLQAIVRAEAGADPSLMYLSVRHGDPGEAARVVNVWAPLFVTRANEIYGSQSSEQVLFFENQLAEASKALETAEQALIDFQSRNRTAIIDNQLLSLQETQASYLADQQAIAFLVQDIQGLRAQLVGQPDNSAVNFADQLTALFLQIRAFNAETLVPLQLQVSTADSLTNQSRSEQIAFLDNLISTMEAKSVEIDDRLRELEPQILVLQRQKQEAETESTRLIRDHDVAQETYISLAHKVEEERITSQDVSSGVRLASQAIVPAKPVSPPPLLFGLLGGAFGIMVSIFLAFAAEWRGAESVQREESKSLANVREYYAGTEG